MEAFDSAAASLVALLPDTFRDFARSYDLHSLIEIVCDQSRPLSLRFADRTIDSDFLVTHADLEYICESRALAPFQSDNRAGVEGTLHRISRISDRNGNVVGLTMRCGRIIENSIELMADLLDTGESILFVGTPGAGKTTAIRQACRYLAEHKRVMIVDTSNEIAGDGSAPHAAVGAARRMQVPQRDRQHEVLTEAVQNHTPEVVVVDELANRQEAEACCSIAERGVQMIASAHGRNLESVVNNKRINDVLGRVMDATVSDTVAEKNGGGKIVLLRRNAAAFKIVVEVVGFGKLLIHHDAQRSVDMLLRGKPLHPESRWVDASGVVHKREEIYTEDVIETPMAEAMRRVILK